MTRYCLGFAFDDTGTNVVLIKKQRPQWQKGLLNGVGGHVEEGESSINAMIREFYEETGVQTTVDQWVGYCYMGDGLEWGCYVFYLKASWVTSKVRSKTDEYVRSYRVSDILFAPEIWQPISNLTWLLPMAQDHMKNNKFMTTTTYDSK